MNCECGKKAEAVSLDGGGKCEDEIRMDTLDAEAEALGKPGASHLEMKKKAAHE